MAFAETKVYFDGSHYIAIPHAVKPPSKRSKSINLEDITPIRQSSEENKSSGLMPVPRKDGKLSLQVLAEQSKEQSKPKQLEKRKIEISDSVHTKKDLLNELYKKYLSLPFKKREEQILADMTVFFPKDKKLDEYVKYNIEKKRRNLICRRTRMVRKANLASLIIFVRSLIRMNYIPSKVSRKHSKRRSLTSRHEKRGNTWVYSIKHFMAVFRYGN